jgi:hypothetical protein
LPFLTGTAVADFLGRVDTSASIGVGLVSASRYMDQYPDSPPSQFVTLSETGLVTMGCLFTVVPQVLSRNAAVLDRAFLARKSQWRMAALLGPRLIWQFAMRRLSLGDIRRRIEQLLQCRVDVLLDVLPELAFDIDTAGDYMYALAKRT